MSESPAPTLTLAALLASDTEALALTDVATATVAATGAIGK
jgi:hypothetical protein